MMTVAFVSCALLPALDIASSDGNRMDMSEADCFAQKARAMAAARHVPFARRFAAALSLLVPAHLRSRWTETREERMLQEALLRLSETSPHLLADIDMEMTEVEAPVDQTNRSRPAVRMTPKASAPAPRPSRLFPAPALPGLYAAE